jgi:hypothetical protein
MRSPSMATTSSGRAAARGGAAGSAGPRTRCAAVAAPLPRRRLRVDARAHLDEHQRAIAVAQDQVDLAAAAPGFDNALDQAQARALQVRQRLVLGGRAARRCCRPASTSP